MPYQKHYFENGEVLEAAPLNAMEDQIAANETAIISCAPLNSPGFTGTPTAPTAAAGTNTTQVATTEFVKEAVSSAMLGALKPSGSISFSNLPSLTALNVNCVYNITDDFTTTADFTEGSGKNYPAGTNVAIINVGTSDVPFYKYDVYGSFIDLSGYRTASAQAAIDATKASISIAQMASGDYKLVVA